MKIGGPKVGGAGRAGAMPAAAQPRPGQGFALQAGASTREAPPTAPSGALGGLGSLDALIALQQVEGPTERRRRAMNRAGRILDVLDEVKLSMLEGADASATMAKLGKAVREERSNTEDPGLEGVLDEIEVRAAVELAKREARAS